MGIKVSDAEVKKSFDQQKKQSFPKDADYQKFLKDYGQTEQDVMQRVKLDLLSNKIRDKVIEGKDKVTDAQIKECYDKNKERFAQPERRDLRIVLTKREAKANEAKQTLEQAKETIRQTLQSQNQQKALDKFVADFQKKWKERTECREGYVTQQCKNAPKPTATPSQTAPTQPAQPAPAAPEDR